MFSATTIFCNINRQPYYGQSLSLYLALLDQMTLGNRIMNVMAMVTDIGFVNGFEIKINFKRSKMSYEWGPNLYIV
jgi:hypothetical protein